MNSGEVGDEGEESHGLEVLELYVHSTTCDMRPYIVWMIAGIAERETACKEIRHWREPRTTVMTLLRSI
jgi:hypothetical protein